MKTIRIPSCSTCRHITGAKFLPISFDHLFSRTASFGLLSLRRPRSDRPRPISSAPLSIHKPFSTGMVLRGSSGNCYEIKELLADRRDPLLCVYRASGDERDFIIKNALEGGFEYQKDLQSPHSNLRTIIDDVAEYELFIYPFMTGDLLHLTQKPLSERQRKDILRQALTGVAALYDRHIIHTDVKPNNILLNYTESPDGSLNIGDVKLSDLEDAVLLPPGGALKGCLCGNQLWRSPESWARARQELSSDIFSFAIVAMYVMLNDMIFLSGLSDEEVNGDSAWRYILHRHISYFGTDTESLQGLVRNTGMDEGPWYGRFIELMEEINAGSPRKPFTEWVYVDESFRDLVARMTNLDPKKRITAHEALEHRRLGLASLGTNDRIPEVRRRLFADPLECDIWKI